jgi:hypothetical protein
LFSKEVHGCALSIVVDQDRIADSQCARGANGVCDPADRFGMGEFLVLVDRGLADAFKASQMPGGWTGNEIIGMFGRSPCLAH